MRIRITFTKQGALRYTGNLDLHKIWERTTRRADLPLAYSQGFHPQPKIQLGAPLPLGFSSRCELVDIWFKTDIELDSLPARLQAALPTGIHVLGVTAITEPSPSLPVQILSSEYEVTLLQPFDADDLSARLAALLECTEITRDRRGKPYNLRPLIESASLHPAENMIRMRLAAREGATGRPEAVLEELGIPFEETRIERSAILLKETAPA